MCPRWSGGPRVPGARLAPSAIRHVLSPMWRTCGSRDIAAVSRDATASALIVIGALSSRAAPREMGRFCCLEGSAQPVVELLRAI